MKEGQDYVVDVDRTATSPDCNPNIIILDRDTGTDQANCQWDEALHQFLQLKHGCKLSLQSLKTVFISNVSFFKLYNKLYGLTGTLGSQRERDLLQEIHKIDFFIIPTAKSKQFHEDKPVLCASKKEWINCIYDEVQKLTKKRSVLIICKTINDVETLRKAFWKKDAKNVHTYTRDYEEFGIAQGTKKLGQEQIIIATNLAGRGTDIKITEKLRETGGLHVCLSYLPDNIRIEQQAFGRAARSGEKGSGRLIIMDTKGQEYSNLKILDIKKQRDAEELHRISNIKAYYETQITVEENYFKVFKKQYEKLKKDLIDNQVPAEVREILLQSCLDKWAFWLDENSKYIKNLIDEQSNRNFYDLVNKFISKLKNFAVDSKNWLTWVEGNPVQMVKLGKYLSQNKELFNANELFDKVIKQESFFSEAAHYYKAFALAKEIDWEQKPLKEGDKKIFKKLKNELREAARLLDKRSKFAINAAGIIGKVKKNCNESIIQIDAYGEQQKNLANIYNIFLRSIDNIFGHIIIPESFVNIDIKEELAEILYTDLLRESILKKPRVKKNISEEKLKVISSSYGVSVETLKDFFSMYKGKEINEKEFLKMLKKKVQLPSRDIFWKLLVEQEILNENVKYITVDNEKLREIDPSLLDFLSEKIDKKELKKQTLESNNEQIFFNIEQIKQQKNNDIFRKDNFVETIGKDKYLVLKKKGVFSFNRKAHIDQSKIESKIFSSYDSITLNDFTKIDIAKNDAEKILADLVEQKVIEKKNDSKNGAYGLKIKFDEMKQVQLLSCPVYENVVRRLLSVCFSYRIVLQRIVKQLEEKNFPIRLQLTTKPHQSLFFELLEQNIIKLSIITEGKDLEEKLKDIYNKKMTKDDLKLMFAQDTLIPEDCTEKLFNCLIKKKWIIKCDSKSSEKNLYLINKPDKRQIPLNFFLGRSHENVLTKAQNIDKTVEKVLGNRLQLTKDDTIKNIVITLERSRSSLKALKVVESNLKPLTEFYDQNEFANTEEVHIFFLNGLDQLLQLGEKEKWTFEMLFNATIVTAMGIGQMVIGAILLSSSVDVMIPLGVAFVSEGVNDIFFVADTLSSGYFSWNNYKKHKTQNLMITAAIAVMGNLHSRGSKLLHFGYKLAGLNFDIGVKNVAEISKLGIEATNIAFKNIKAIAMHTMNEIIARVVGLDKNVSDIFLENYLNVLCEKITSSILSNIEQGVERHNISINLEKAYKILGGKEAKNIIDNLTKNAFARYSYIEKFLSIAEKIAKSVIQEITKAVIKKNEISMKVKLKLPICDINKAIWSKCVTAQVIHITKITDDLLNYLDQEIKNELNKTEKNAECGSLSPKQETKEVYESFKTDVIDQWKSLLREKAGKIIAQHISKPIYKTVTNEHIRYIEKYKQERHHSCEENKLNELFRKSKQQYHGKLLNASEVLFTLYNNTSQTGNFITKQFHEMSIELMTRFNSPEVFIAKIQKDLDKLILPFGALGGAKAYKSPMFTNKLNESAEKKYPYQHFYKGKWEFNTSKDLDLREDEPLSNEKLYSQRVKGYLIGIKKINQYIHNIDKKVKFLDLMDYKEIIYDSILCAGIFDKLNVVLYPVEIKAPVVLNGMKYTAKLDLRCPVIKDGLQGPHGPHIGYKVIRHDIQAPKGIPLGIIGHILLNPNSELPNQHRSSYANDSNIPSKGIISLFSLIKHPNINLERIEEKNILLDKKKILIVPNFRKKIKGRAYSSPDF